MKWVSGEPCINPALFRRWVLQKWEKQQAYWHGLSWAYFIVPWIIFFVSLWSSLNFLSFALIQGAKEALDLGITGPEGIEISRPEEVRKTSAFFVNVLPIDS